MMNSFYNVLYCLNWSDCNSLLGVDTWSRCCFFVCVGHVGISCWTGFIRRHIRLHTAYHWQKFGCSRSRNWGWISLWFCRKLIQPFLECIRVTITEADNMFSCFVVVNYSAHNVGVYCFWACQVRVLIAGGRSGFWWRGCENVPTNHVAAASFWCSSSARHHVFPWRRIRFR